MSTLRHLFFSLRFTFSAIQTTNLWQDIPFAAHLHPSRGNMERRHVGSSSRHRHGIPVGIRKTNTPSLSSL
ncbi:hypothetical protein CKAH01_13239 [Colletotrichum kahawae]|uniref:Secreted protein n=1 Tax=Colletotrichum kahawae TaxID=34407 RepID=A0AAD9YR92_COLKA|nr:hypothetical protein CKAH01_13239 [Colletotrichum kahawae]